MEPSRKFGHQIKMLSNAFERALNRSCDCSGLTGAQAFVMNYVVRNQHRAIYAKTLEQEFHLKHPTVCGILQRLESKGFVTFAQSISDRRCKQIVPTQKAIEAHEQAKQMLDAVDRQLLIGFSKEETEQFYHFLDRAAANISKPWMPEHPEQEKEEVV